MDGYEKKRRELQITILPLHLKSLCNIILFYLFYGTNHNLTLLYLHVYLFTLYKKHSESPY